MVVLVGADVEDTFVGEDSDANRSGRLVARRATMKPHFILWTRGD